jgi:TPR repeat protein
MYAGGVGVEKNDARALEWLQEGQRRGSPWAFLALSSVYRFGELGQPIDSSKADELGVRAQELIEERAERGRSQ